MERTRLRGAYKRSFRIHLEVSHWINADNMIMTMTAVEAAAGQSAGAPAARSESERRRTIR